jgi:hypothetical protein
MDVIDRLAGIIGENPAILTPIFRRQKNTSHHHHDSVTSLWPLLLTLLLLIFYLESKAWSNEMVIYLDGHMVEADISTRIYEGEVMVPVVAFCQFLNQELEIAIKVEWPAGEQLLVLCLEQRCQPLLFRGRRKSALKFNGQVYAPFGQIIQLLDLPNRIEIRPKNWERTKRMLDLALINLEGKLIHLSQFKGKKTLLYVWASW